MWRQRNISQMKEQNKTQKNKMETSNPSDAEFETLAIRMFNELRRRVDKLSVKQKWIKCSNQKT